MRDVFRGVLDAQQPTIYIGIDELQVLEGILPSNHQVQKWFSEFLFDVDALIHRFAD